MGLFDFLRGKPKSALDALKSPGGSILVENSFAQITPERIREEKIQGLIGSIFPIVTQAPDRMLDFLKFKFGEPEQDGAPLILTLRMMFFDFDADGAKFLTDVSEEDIILVESVPLPIRPAEISRNYREAIFNVASIVRQRLAGNSVRSAFELFNNIPIPRFAWETIEA